MAKTKGWGTMRLDPPDRTPIRMVILERAPSGPMGSLGSRRDLAELVVLFHAGTRSLVDLALSAVGRIKRIEHDGQHVVEAVLMIGDERGGRAHAARAILGRALMAHQEAMGSGEIVLQAEPSADHGLRHEVLTLAGTLTSEARDGSVGISVRFGPELQPLPTSQLAEGVIDVSVEDGEAPDELDKSGVRLRASMWAGAWG